MHNRKENQGFKKQRKKMDDPKKGLINIVPMNLSRIIIGQIWWEFISILLSFFSLCLWHRRWLWFVKVMMMVTMTVSVTV